MYHMSSAATSVVVEASMSIPFVSEGASTKQTESDSESEDDLQLIVNDEDYFYPHYGKGIEKSGKEGSEEDDGEDLVIVGGDEHYVEAEWAAEMPMFMDPMGGESDKSSADGQQAPVAGMPHFLGRPYYHHSQFKYIRPGSEASATTASVQETNKSQQCGTPVRTSSMPAVNNQWALHSPWSAFEAYEFVLPPSKTIFDIDLDHFEDKPWHYPGTDITDYFNFGFNEESWKSYCEKLVKQRTESPVQNKPSRGLENGRSQGYELENSGNAFDSPRFSNGRRGRGANIGGGGGVGGGGGGRIVQLENSEFERQPFELRRQRMRDNGSVMQEIGKPQNRRSDKNEDLRWKHRDDDLSSTTNEQMKRKGSLRQAEQPPVLSSPLAGRLGNLNVCGVSSSTGLHNGSPNGGRYVESNAPRSWEKRRVQQNQHHEEEEDPDNYCGKSKDTVHERNSAQQVSVRVTGKPVMRPTGHRCSQRDPPLEEKKSSKLVDQQPLKVDIQQRPQLLRQKSFNNNSNSNNNNLDVSGSGVGGGDCDTGGGGGGGSGVCSEVRVRMKERRVKEVIVKEKSPLKIEKLKVKNEEDDEQEEEEGDVCVKVKADDNVKMNGNGNGNGNGNLKNSLSEKEISRRKATVRAKVKVKEKCVKDDLRLKVLEKVSARWKLHLRMDDANAKLKRGTHSNGRVCKEKGGGGGDEEQNQEYSQETDGVPENSDGSLPDRKEDMVNDSYAMAHHQHQHHHHHHHHHHHDEDVVYDDGIEEQFVEEENWEQRRSRKDKRKEKREYKNSSRSREKIRVAVVSDEVKEEEGGERWRMEEADDDDDGWGGREETGGRSSTSTRHDKSKRKKKRRKRSAVMTIAENGDGEEGNTAIAAAAAETYENHQTERRSRSRHRSRSSARSREIVEYDDLVGDECYDDETYGGGDGDGDGNDVTVEQWDGSAHSKHRHRKRKWVEEEEEEDHGHGHGHGYGHDDAHGYSRHQRRYSYNDYVDEGYDDEVGDANGEGEYVYDDEYGYGYGYGGYGDGDGDGDYKGGGGGQEESSDRWTGSLYESDGDEHYRHHHHHHR